MWVKNCKSGELSRAREKIGRQGVELFMNVSNEEKEENELILDISGKIRNNYSIREGKATLL